MYVRSMEERNLYKFMVGKSMRNYLPGILTIQRGKILKYAK
jgi:hypothetical protein